MVAFKYAVITTGLSACAGAVASVVHKRPISKGCDLRASASVIADMPKTTEFDAPSPTSLGTANNHLQRPLARGIYWSTNTASGSKLSPRAFVMPPHANLLASATALAASTMSLVIDLVHSALSLALGLGSSAISSAATWALSPSSSISPVNKPPAVAPPNDLAASAHAVTTALESHADASATTTLLGSAVAYAMSIVGSTFVGAKIAALASATSQVNSARSTALALHTSALTSATALLDSALSSASALKGTAVATATNLDEAALSSAAAILSSALSAAAVLIPSALATPTSGAFVLEKAPPAREAAMQSAARSSAPSLLTWVVHFAIRPVLTDVTSVISWIREGLLADPVPAPTPTRTVVASRPVPS